MSTTALNSEVLSKQQKSLNTATENAPITILQIGEGNFLRGFFDWMLHETKKLGLYEGAVAVVQPRPAGKPKIEALAAQDGLYTLVTRGLEQGVPSERNEIISVFGEVFDPYSQWQKFLDLAQVPTLRFVVSNTTEAGLVYREEELIEGEPVLSYPGKLTLLLYYRFLAFNGAAERGLICLPCELLERNGDTLRECVLSFCDAWKLPEAFKEWVMEHNRFLNSLVDRIVTGYPQEEQAQEWFQQWGYSDPLLTTAEPYHLWAIEAEKQLHEELPLAKAGLNVLWVDDLRPYQLRKVRILNGSHTFMALLGLLHDVKEVRAAMEHESIGALIRATVEHEIIATLPYDQADLKQYANEVYDRFLNPFIQHRLSDIAMNSLSKFKMRLLPSIRHYLDQDKQLPDGLATAFTAFLRYYKVSKVDGEFFGVSFSGEGYVLRDDAALLEKLSATWACSNAHENSFSTVIANLLSIEELWGTDLNADYPALATKLSEIWLSWEG